MVRSRLLSSAALEVCRLSSRKARSLKGERGREGRRENAGQRERKRERHGMGVGGRKDDF